MADDEAFMDELSRESFPASDAFTRTQGVEPEPGEAARAGTRSLWSATATAPRHEPLTEDISADVCVVGAGFAGLTTAYLLAKGGRKVVVIDAADAAGGESGATTAQLSTVPDAGYVELERLHGDAACRLVVDSHASAIDMIDQIVAEEKIDCGFERLDGYLFLAPGGSLENLRAELDAARRCGLGVEFVERVPLAGFKTSPALKVSRQGQCHPVKYLSGLADAVERLGGRIFGGTRALSVEDGVPACVRVLGGRTITADAVVVAANVPFNDRVTLHTRQYAYRTYVIAARVPRGSVTKALFWDTADPYHYVRIQSLPAEDALIMGGEDHKTGQHEDTEGCFWRLESWARSRFEFLGSIEYRWSGQVIEPVDGLAFIGRNPGERNVYVITGQSGNGTTYGTLGALIISDLIAGRPNPWAQVYSPSRARARGAAHWFKENLNAASRYADYATPGDISSADNIAAGSGAVVRHGLRKVASFRGTDGALHECSAVCPHLGGLVCWNSAEKSWDCPIHGSRFDTAGGVLNGPAVSGLSPVEHEHADNRILTKKH